MKRLNPLATLTVIMFVLGTVGGCAHSTVAGKNAPQAPAAEGQPGDKADRADRAEVPKTPLPAPSSPVILIAPRQPTELIPSPAAMRMQGKMRSFWQVWEIVQKGHIDGPFTDKQMLEAAMRGLAKVAKDKHTSYLSPELMKQWAESDRGSYAGIGAVLSFEDKKLYVTRVLPNSPAQKAGLLAGDQITDVDGTDTSQIDLVKAVNLIRGLKGSPTVLTIARHGVAKPFKVMVTRDELVLRSVDIKMLSRHGKRLAHITLERFNKPALRDFRRAVKKALWWRADGVILDLRWNPGGYVSVVQLIASAWIGEKVLFHEKDSQFRLRALTALPMQGVTNAFRDMPTVVLINEHAASASEILAGALQDHGVAPIVGEKSYGKGSVQVLRDLDDGGGIKVTIRKWLTPKKHKINGVGVKPDVAVKQPSKLTKAQLQERRDARAAGKRWNPPDPQLDKATEILLSKCKKQKRRRPNNKAKRR